MKAASKLPARTDLAAESKPTLNIVIAYADQLTYQIAMRACSRVLRRIRRSFTVHSVWFSFDALGRAYVLEQAAVAAVKSDLIFCSVYATETLPAPVKAWIVRWLPRTGQSDGALVALLKTTDQTNRAPLNAEIDLSVVAKAARMDFLVKVFDQPVPETSPFDLPHTARRTARANRFAAERHFSASLTPPPKPPCGFA